MKTKILVMSAALSLLAIAGPANADSNGAAMNSCKPHDWNRFTAAVEAMDYDTLAAMAREPELRICEFAETIDALVCAIEPLACIEPAAPPPPPPPVVDRLDARPLPPPGAHIGVESDQRDPGPTGGGGGGGGGGDNPSGTVR